MVADRAAAEAAALAHLLGRGAPRAPDRETLEAWGRALGAVLPRPVVVALAGDLSAGKTTLARALCAGLGVFDVAAVTSPTFSLVQEYEAVGGSVVHVDLYRLRSDAELDGLGWDEVLRTAQVLLMEWPERVLSQLPTSTIHIALSHDLQNANRRILRVRAPHA